MQIKLKTDEDKELFISNEMLDNNNYVDIWMVEKGNDTREEETIWEVSCVPIEELCLAVKAFEELRVNNK